MAKILRMEPMRKAIYKGDAFGTMIADMFTFMYGHWAEMSNVYMMVGRKWKRSGS